MYSSYNPYAPGAGTAPPELAGRNKVRTDVATAIDRIRHRRAAKSVIMVGLRGVGKTVLLDQMRLDAEKTGIATVMLEAAEERSLPSMLAPDLRSLLLRLSRIEQAKEVAHRALRALSGFVGSLKMKYADIEVSLDLPPEPGLADNGDLQSDLTALLEQVGTAAEAANTAVVIFLDEIQYVRRDQFAALITALHRCAQRRLPLMLVGAGLPQLRALAGDAKSYAERLFEFPLVGPLAAPDAAAAILKPAEHEGVAFTPEAIDAILRETRGYPYFLQEWGKHAWDVAQQSPIALEDIHQATIEAVAALDASFFRVRLDRITRLGRRYARAMAELGEGPHRSGDIAAVLNKPVQSFGPIRSDLIAKGMIWSPAFGDTAFTVPLFDEYLRRIMPGDSWRTD